jgi:hypothetical protein
MLFKTRGFLAPRPTPKWKAPLVGCPRLLIQHIRSYHPHLEVVPPTATWGRAIPWWQGPTNHRSGLIIGIIYGMQVEVCCVCILR